VTISGPGGKTRIDWPSCTVTSEGKPPSASTSAAGLRTLAVLSARDRAGLIGAILHADPTRADLESAFADQGLAGAVETIWQLIEAQGWDQAHALRKEQGAQYKGEWRRVTGVNYGSRIAAAWVPKGWAAAEEKLDEEDFVDTLARAKTAHERAVAAAAVSDAEREQLIREAGEQKSGEHDLQLATRAAKEAQAALEQATAARQALPAAEAATGIPCPHCGKPLEIRRLSLVEQSLVKVEPIAAAELKRRRTAIAEADGEISRLRGELQTKHRTAALAQVDLDKSIAAQAQVAALTPGDKSAGGSVETTRAAVETAAARLLAFRQKRDADRLSDAIATNDQILDVLAADGLRAKKLARVLDAFNGAQLKPLTDAAQWKACAIEPDMALTYGGRRYGLLSTSEQYRVRVALQVAMARIEGADLVVIDAADVLDAPTRSGLFRLISAAGIPAVVSMTLARREQVPDLAALRLGASYWLENGLLEQLRVEANAAA
jgi:hypothetical protein